MTRFALSALPVGERYEGDILCPSNWRGSRKGGGDDPDYEIRILAAHPDGGYLYEWRARGGDPDARGQLGHAPEDNLRRLFRPVGWEMEKPREEAPDGES